MIDVIVHYYKYDNCDPVLSNYRIRTLFALDFIKSSNLVYEITVAMASGFVSGMNPLVILCYAPS